MTNMPTEAVAMLCQNAINKDDNLHFFVNSVEFIARVIKGANLTPQQVRVVCSTSGDSLAKNTAKLGSSFPIESTKDPVKKINFYTSTSFEGCDIFDVKGRTCIVTVGGRDHTLLDIPTTFRQVCGRLRDSRYKNEVTLLFSGSYNTSVSVNDFAAKTKASYRYAQSYCNMVNASSDTEREEHIEKHRDTT